MFLQLVLQKQLDFGQKTNPFLLMMISQWPSKFSLILFRPSQIPSKTFSSHYLKSRSVCWSPSINPLVKVFFFFLIESQLILMVQCLRSREAWIRVVVRNSQDFVLASMKEKILLPHLVANVESMAAVRAFKFCSRPQSFVHYF